MEFVKTIIAKFRRMTKDNVIGTLYLLGVLTICVLGLQEKIEFKAYIQPLEKGQVEFSAGWYWNEDGFRLQFRFVAWRIILAWWKL